MNKKMLIGLFVCVFAFQAKSIDPSWFEQTHQCPLDGEESGFPTVLAVVANLILITADYYIIQYMAEE